MIIISALLINLPFRIILSSILIAAITFLTIFFESKKIFITPFNYGFEPITPTIIFGFTGILTGLIMNKLKVKKNYPEKFVFSLLIIGLSIFTFYSFKFGLFKIFSNIGRYEVTRIFSESKMINILLSGKTVHDFFYVRIWNYNTDCFIDSLGSVLILFSSMFFLEKIFVRFFPENSFLPGRFAFFNYFYHLGLIALLVLTIGYNNLNLILFLSFLTFLFITSYLIPYLFLLIKRSRDSTKASPRNNLLH